MVNSNNLLCKFTGKVIEVNGSYYVEVPEDEIQYGSIDVGDPVSVSLTDTNHSNTPNRTRGSRGHNKQPPVEKGDQEEVEIEDIGEQGDGIGRIDGYVVIVPDTNLGDVVTVEIKDVNDDYAYAVVVDEHAIEHE